MDIHALFQSDLQICEISAVQQHWQKNLPGVDLLQAPRRNYGFLLLTDYPATFSFPDGTVYSAVPGDIVLLQRGAQYSIRFHFPPDEIAKPYLINLRLKDIAGNEPVFQHAVTHICKDDGTLLPLFVEAATLYKTGAHPAQLKAIVYRLISLLFPLHKEDTCCIGYINSHFTEQFSIPQLAKQCALSESVFRRRFRQLTGSSPVQYITQLKIEKACQLLQSGDIRPEDISNFLHFYSVSYFYRVFKSVTGLTPMEYRRQNNIF